MTGATMLAVVLKATLVLSLGLTCLRLAHHQPASVRHVIAAAALAAAALLPLTIAWLPEVPVVLQSRAVDAATVMPSEGTAAAPPAARTHAPAHGRVSLSTVTAISWAVGAVVCLLPSLAALLQAYRIGRVGRAWRMEESVVPTVWGNTRLTIPVLLHGGLASPLACGVFRPFIALPLSAATWSPADIQRALAHELAHVRRHDVVIQGLARVVCAAYWFHPLVWVCWRRLRLEAERACDDAVLAQFDAPDYASQLLRIARGGAGRTSSLLPTMARRGELTTRVEAILDSRQCRSTRREVVLPIMLVAVLSAALVGSATPTVAYVGRRAATSPVSFAVSTIKKTASNAPMTLVREQDGSVRMRAITLETLVRLAYGVQAEAIVDAPAWARTTRFELEATPTAPTSPETTRVMLRNLLVERFGLEVVDESRLQRVLVVTLPAWSQQAITPCEPDLQRAMRDAERARRPCGFQLAPGRIDATAVDAEALAATLATTLGRRVFVERATPGRFDIHLHWRSDIGASALLEALRSQAGATITEHERPVPVLAVRTVHRPV
jgi:uncharacterized protein (TIGR03435 family)